MTRLTLSVKGLRCDHCVQAVTAAVTAVEGVVSCQVDLQRSTAAVEFDEGKTSRERISQAVETAGYEVGLPIPPVVALSVAQPGKGVAAVPVVAAPTLPHGRSDAAEATAGASHDFPDPAPGRPDGPSDERLLFDVKGMHCASCVQRVEDALLELTGVREAHANLAMNQVSVVWQRSGTTPDQIVGAMRQAGYDAEPSAAPEAAADSMLRREQAAAEFWRRRLLVAVALLIPLMLVALCWPAEAAWLGGMLQWAIATPIQFYVGWPYLRGAWLRLLQRSANMDTLVALGTTTAYVAGMLGLAAGADMLTFGDAAMILTFITLGKFLEVKAKGRASTAIRRLLQLAPSTAHVQVNGKITEVPASHVEIDQTIVVRPGDRIPLDAQVIAGYSDVDEAWLTGESATVDKGPAQTIFAGTINGSGALTARVVRRSNQTTLAQTIELVRKAQESKADVQRFADRVVAWFVPAVLVLSLVTLAVWLALGEPRVALTCTISILIVACPCALGLATPTAVLVGSGRGAEQGILIKNAQSLEQAGRVNTVVLDKTGTITAGKPVVEQLMPAAGVTEQTLLVAAAAAEQLSSHPLARAIVKEAERQGLLAAGAVQLEVVPGQGIVTQWQQHRVCVGTEQLLAQYAVSTNPLDSGMLERLRSSGQTVLFVAQDEQLLGAISLADPVAPHSREGVQLLQDMGLDVIMLSGDKRPTALAVSLQVGLSSVIAQVRPDEKQRAIAQLQQQGRVVAMVGDGINDAPALAAADLGIAIGTGADVAIETADIVLVKQDLRKVAEAIRLSRATLRTIKQNLWWSFGYNLLLIPLAAGLIVPLAGKGILHLLPAFSAIAMATSSVSVVANSLLLRSKPLH